MPELRNVLVHVTTRDGEPLREWGTQKIDRSGQVTCFVQSQTDMAFKVSVQPRLPFEQERPLPESRRRSGGNAPFRPNPAIMAQGAKDDGKAIPK